MLQPPKPLHLRPLQLSDLSAVDVIEQQSFPTPTPAKGYRYELSENKLAHYQALTARHKNQDEQLLGYAGYWLIAGEMHISIIAVDPSWRGRGLGELLLLNMLYLAYEAAAVLVTLEVRESNQIAQDLYLKYAFDIVGVRQRYYRDTGENALVMTVQIKSNSEYRCLLDQKQKMLNAKLASTPF